MHVENNSQKWRHKNKCIGCLHSYLGNSYESIEGLRRSLHFSPRKHADVALLNLANVLHRGRFSSEAAIVLHAALDNAKVRFKGWRVLALGCSQITNRLVII